MEPNTSCPSSSSTRTSSAILEQRLFAAHAQTQSLLSPPSQGFLSASGSRSRLPAVWDGSLSVHGRVTSKSLLSSFFPTLQAPATSAFPAALGGQPWQGLGLPSCPLATLEQIAARPQSVMSLLSPTAGSGGLPPLSSVAYRVGVAQPASHSELPPLPASLRIPSPEEASAYSVTGGAIDGSMPWHCADADSSMAMDISSVPNLTTGAMMAPMLPLMPPASHGSGASNNFVRFTQPSSNSELAPLPACLQTPLLRVKQKPIDATGRGGSDQDAIPQSIPDNSIARTLSWETALKLPVETRVAGGSTHCHDRSMSVDVDSSSSTPKLLQPLPPIPDNSIARALSRETALKLPVETRVVGGSAPCHDLSMSVDADSSSSTPKLLQPLPPSAVRAGASSSRSHVRAGVVFTDSEKEIIRKDKNLQELVREDPKRAKRILSNRMSAAKRKAMKDKHTLELERKVEIMQTKCYTTSEALKSLQERCAELEAGNKQLSMMIKDLERQAMLKDAESERLKAQLNGLMHNKFTQRK